KMAYQFTSDIIPHLISLMLLIFLGIYGYKHKEVKGALSFTICIIISSLWISCYMFGIAAVEVQTKIFWSNLQYFAFAFCPVFWLIMVLQFTNKEKWLNKRNIILMTIIPVITSFLAWTDKNYGLLRRDFALNPSGSYPFTNEFGSWFTVHYIYSYILLFLAVALLINTIWKKNSIFKKQAAFLLTGFILLLITDLVYIADIIHWERIYIDTLVFDIAALIFGTGIFYYQIFDLVPVARETVIEEMESGLIVLDKKKRIIDINPQARKMFRTSGKIKSGQKLSILSSKLNQLVISTNTALSKKEFSLNDKEGIEHHYEVYISSIDSNKSNLTAWILFINDITALKIANKQIEKHIKELAVMKEREKMARDLHDNLGHVLGFIDIQLQAACKKLKIGEYKVADQYLQKLNNKVKDTHKEVREYVLNMRNEAIYNKDFVELIKEELEKISEDCFLKIEFLIIEELDLGFLSTEEKFHLLHIFKEAVNNTLKHAKADKIIISLDKVKDNIKMCIADDGQGMKNSNLKSGSGLSIMNERARLISAKLKIESELGKGSRVIVTFSRKRRFEA
ncbi:MAG: histidine kinase N-terminal 7TM domain-containing protein, partial [Bacillota bacterium]